MRNTLLFTVLLLIVTACSSGNKMFSGRNPSSFKFTLNELIKDINKQIKVGASSNLECTTKVSLYYGKLFNLRPDEYGIESFSKGDIRSVIADSFEARLEIKEKLKELDFSTEGSRECLTAVQDMVRALRYVEDYMIELEYFGVSYFKNMDFVSLNGAGSLFLKNPKFEFNGVQDLKSGDLILSRGNAYSSAAIARIGNVDMQFSHLSLVYEREDGKMYTIEAHIEIGSVVAPLQEHIDQKNARSVVFRHSDSKLAHEAAKKMYKRVKAQQDKKKNVEYDFEMNYKDGKRLFCSEIVSEGFNKASKKLYNKELDIPKYKTKFNKGLIPFLNIMGIKINESNYADFDTFAPGDIQFDPSFTLVAEWRNPKKMRDNRFKDAILTKMFEWMENEGYQLYPPAGIIIKSRFSWLMRRTPFIKKMLEEKFPLNMNSKQLRLFLVLDLVGEKFYNVVSDAQKVKGRVLSPVEIYDVLDQFKLNDYNRYIKYKQLVKKSRRYGPRSKVPYHIKKEIKETRPVFHRYFHN
jgi:hypothetical protein